MSRGIHDFLAHGCACLVELNHEDQELVVQYDERKVVYDYSELDELILAYATTIHKAQGNEHPCVVIPIHTQHYMMLQRNLLYTAITRGRWLVVLVGAKRAVGRTEAGGRITTLKERLMDGASVAVDGEISR